LGRVRLIYGFAGSNDKVRAKHDRLQLDWTLKKRLIITLLFLLGAGQNAIAQNAPGMSKEEMEALRGFIGKEDPLDLTGEPNKTGKGGFFQGGQGDPNAPSDPNKISVAPKSVIGTGTIITKAQQHAAKVSVSKDFLKQMQRLKDIPPEQVDLYLRYRPSAAARKDVSVQNYEKQQWDQLVSGYKAKHRNKARLDSFDREMDQSLGKPGAGSGAQGSAQPTNQQISARATKPGTGGTQSTTGQSGSNATPRGPQTSGTAGSGGNKSAAAQQSSGNATGVSSGGSPNTQGGAFNAGPSGPGGNQPQGRLKGTGVPGGSSSFAQMVQRLGIGTSGTGSSTASRTGTPSNQGQHSGKDQSQGQSASASTGSTRVAAKPSGSGTSQSTTANQSRNAQGPSSAVQSRQTVPSGSSAIQQGGARSSQAQGSNVQGNTQTPNTAASGRSGSTGSQNLSGASSTPSQGSQSGSQTKSGSAAATASSQTTGGSSGRSKTTTPRQSATAQPARPGSQNVSTPSSGSQSNTANTATPSTTPRSPAGPAGPSGTAQALQQALAKATSSSGPSASQSFSSQFGFKNELSRSQDTNAQGSSGARQAQSSSQGGPQGSAGTQSANSGASQIQSSGQGGSQGSAGTQSANSGASQIQSSGQSGSQGSAGAQSTSSQEQSDSQPGQLESPGNQSTHREGRSLTPPPPPPPPATSSEATQLANLTQKDADTGSKSAPSTPGNNVNSKDAASLRQSKEAQNEDTAATNSGSQEAPKDIHETRMDTFAQNAKEIAAIDKYLASQGDPTVKLTEEEARIVEEQKQRVADLTGEDAAHLTKRAGDFDEAANSLPTDEEFAAYQEEVKGGKTWTNHLAGAKSIVLGSKIFMRVGKYFQATKVVAEVGEAAIEYTEAAVGPPTSTDNRIRKSGDVATSTGKAIEQVTGIPLGRGVHIYDGAKGAHDMYVGGKGLVEGQEKSTGLDTAENTLNMTKGKYDMAREFAKYHGKEALGEAIDKVATPLGMAHDATKTVNEATKIHAEWSENHKYFDGLERTISNQAQRNRQTRSYLESQRDRRRIQVLLYEFERSKFNNALR